LFLLKSLAKVQKKNETRNNYIRKIDADDKRTLQKQGFGIVQEGRKKVDSVLTDSKQNALFPDTMVFCLFRQERMNSEEPPRCFFTMSNVACGDDNFRTRRFLFPTTCRPSPNWYDRKEHLLARWARQG